MPRKKAESWRFRRDGCHRCGCRNLLIKCERITVDKVFGLLPRKLSAECCRCREQYVYFTHSDRVERIIHADFVPHA